MLGDGAWERGYGNNPRAQEVWLCILSVLPMIVPSIVKIVGEPPLIGKYPKLFPCPALHNEETDCFLINYWCIFSVVSRTLYKKRDVVVGFWIKTWDWGLDIYQIVL